MVETIDWRPRLLHALGLGLPISLSVTMAVVMALARSPSLLVLGLGMIALALTSVALLLWMRCFEQDDELGWEVWLILVLINCSLVALTLLTAFLAHS